MRYYNIERYVDGQWIHCTWGGKTKKLALERLRKVAGYARHEGMTFRIVWEDEDE